MAFSQIEMDTSTLQRDIDTLDDLIRRTREQKRKLITTVEELNSMWSGRANSAFNAQFQTDMANFDNALEVLGEIRNSLENAKSEYNSCEQKVEGIINSITV